MGKTKILLPSVSSVVLPMCCVSDVGYLLIGTGTCQVELHRRRARIIYHENDKSERGMWNVYFRNCGVFYFHAYMIFFLFLSALFLEPFLAV
ncbi:hypothetical protein BKA64DRAFT_449912 [Cadophora sp. MPI-SDFR-AT-0126]|nr:hypothetical protein BKA64DRAFT_449912 [Leotiomycetes sp. MPI-SDFR-AT-0126]